MCPRGSPNLEGAGAHAHGNGHKRGQDTFFFFRVKKTAIFDLQLTRFTKRVEDGLGLLAPHPRPGRRLQDSLSDQLRLGPPVC